MTADGTPRRDPDRHADTATSCRFYHLLGSALSQVVDPDGNGVDLFAPLG